MREIPFQLDTALMINLRGSEVGRWRVKKMLEPGPFPCAAALELDPALPLLHPQHRQGGVSPPTRPVPPRAKCIRLWGALYFRGCLYLKCICLSFSSCVSFCTALGRWNVTHSLLCALHAVGMTRVSFPWSGLQVTDPWPGKATGRSWQWW